MPEPRRTTWLSAEHWFSPMTELPLAVYEAEARSWRSDDVRWMCNCSMLVGSMVCARTRPGETLGRRYTEKLQGGVDKELGASGT